MLEKFTPAQVGISVAELIFLLTGVGVCWWLKYGRSGVLFQAPRLPGWAVSVSTFGLAIVEALGGGIFGMILARLLTSFLPPAITQDTAFSTVVINAGLHLGVLGGVALFCYSTPAAARPSDAPSLPPPVRPPLETRPALFAGVLTFCATVLLLIPISYAWDTLLKWLGVPVEKQELIQIFAKADTPAKLLVMSLVAIVIAPLTEELTFRAGFFRFLRGRVPRWLAFVLPSIVFASLHNNLAVLAPLFALGVIFSFAYERTGRVLVPMVAHALFNLNTILLILIMGVDM